MTRQFIKDWNKHTQGRAIHFCKVTSPFSYCLLHLKLLYPLCQSVLNPSSQELLLNLMTQWTPCFFNPFLNPLKRNRFFTQDIRHYRYIRDCFFFAQNTDTPKHLFIKTRLYLNYVLNLPNTWNTKTFQASHNCQSRKKDGTFFLEFSVAMHSF